MGRQDVDLLGWLRERDQQSGGAAVGSPKPAGAVVPDTGGSAPKHQQAAEVAPSSSGIQLYAFLHFQQMRMKCSPAMLMHAFFA